MVDFPIFCVFFKNFLQIKFFTNFHKNWLTSVSGISVAVGISADASTIVSVSLLTSLLLWVYLLCWRLWCYYYLCYCRPPDCYKCSNCEFLLLLLVYLLNIAGFSTVADFPSVWFWQSCCCWHQWCSNCPCANWGYIIPDVNGVHAVIGLPVGCCLHA